MQWVQEPFITNTAMQCYGYLSNIYISLRAEILRDKGVQKRLQKKFLYEKRHLKHLNDLTMRYYKFCHAEIFSKEKNRLALVVRKSSCGEFRELQEAVCGQLCRQR